MLEAKNKGAFSIVDYKVKEFFLKEPVESELQIALRFKPSGKYNSTNGSFRLFLDFDVVYGENNDTSFIVSKFEATFQFTPISKPNEIPEYFYANCIAIIFPYLRAFVSTLTSVANINTLILPTLNLSFLETELKSATIFED